MPEFPELSGVPDELAVCIGEFWPESEWRNAADIARFESAFDPFAIRDTRSADHPCGSQLTIFGGVSVTAELSVGYFQINACNLPPGWEWQRLYNARHNAGTAHMLWDRAGQSWRPWYFSAKALGLIETP